MGSRSVGAWGGPGSFGGLGVWDLGNVVVLRVGGGGLFKGCWKSMECRGMGEESLLMWEVQEVCGV